MMITDIEDYFAKGCGRCARFDTADCSTRFWAGGLADLRRICRAAGLVEVVKWGHPCYMHTGRNIAIIGALRGDLRLSFFNAAPFARTRVKRTPDKARYDAATMHAIPDACPVVHVGYVIDDAPFVTPTLAWRDGDRIYWHGSAASRMLRAVDGAAVCLTATLTDGIVMARSAIAHSVNDRSVMVMGQAAVTHGHKAKAAQLERFVELHWPGRWAALRPMTAEELKATSVLSMPLDDASAKVSTGMATEAPGDETWPIWSGIIPVAQTAGAPQADPACVAAAMPGHIRNYVFGRITR